MRIHIIHQYFKTPSDGGGIRSYYVAKYLRRQGHEVAVITAYNGDEIKRKVINGIEVHYLPVYYTNHLSFWSRLHAFYRFVWMSIRKVRSIPSADVNYVISTPLSTGLIALYLKWLKKIPFVFEVGDLWPKAPIQLKVIKNPIIKATAIWLEKKVYQQAESIIALSPDIQTEIKKIVPGKVVSLITNVADVDFFSLQKKDKSLLKEFDLDGKFVVSYTGTVGLANHLEYLLSVAKVYSKNHEVAFIIMGSGARWDHIRTLARKESLDNIMFLPPGDKEQVRDVLSISDAVYISFKDAPILASGSPNKFFDGLAAGKLIIINFKGWIKEVIEQNHCGFAYDPHRPDQFVKQLTPYLTDESHLKRSQCAARRLAEQDYSTDKQLQNLQYIFKQTSTI